MAGALTPFASGPTWDGSGHKRAAPLHFRTESHFPKKFDVVAVQGSRVERVDVRKRGREEGWGQRAGGRKAKQFYDLGVGKGWDEIVMF